jgi:hypothetical protein
LFETSSSISGDSEDEDQFPDGKCDEDLKNRFMQQGGFPDEAAGTKIELR